MSLLGSAVLAKYAPVIFLMVTPKGVQFNTVQIAQTLIVAFIVSAVTMYGTTRVLETKMEHMERSISQITTMANEALKVQREIVPMRNLQVKLLQEDAADMKVRITALEKRR